MRKLRAYLETSIFGLLFDEAERNREKKQAVEKLLLMANKGTLCAETSLLTVEELSRTPEPLGSQLLGCLDCLATNKFEEEEDDVLRLARLYVDEGIIPPDYLDDARHIAYATVGEYDLLITFNYEHIANQFRLRRIRAVNCREGYWREPAIVTPLEIGHED